MTVNRGTRRFHNFTEEVTPRETLVRHQFNLRQLQPWLYKEIPSSRPSKIKKMVRNAASPERIRAWLVANGNATAVEVAVALRIEPQTACAALGRGIAGIGVVEIRKAPGKKPVRVWGVVADEHAE